MAVRVYLANDHDIVREGLKSLLSKNAIFSIIGEINGAIDLVNAVDRFRPNLLFVDIESREHSSMKAIVRLRETYSKMLIVAVVYHPEKDLLEELTNINVNGIFSVDFKIEELVRGLADILTKGSYIQSNIYNKLEQGVYTSSSDRYKINSLTKREMEVLIQVANGMFNKEIAIALNITERTVKNHLSTIFKKIEVADRTQAAIFAIRNNMIEI